ncbi:aldo/keto reductase [Desulfoluna spongiiphila]|uniref:aldo/keto reductase n=1 Tax=Desulfoluna spongiiphila TaxID=419481 RepID=UPI001256D771|nr:aldo/keto reductase [Desulfoluna spongiiphila]VVS92635.1 alpha-helical ferredoxin [Desulfoluna spongiiphila]
MQYRHVPQTGDRLSALGFGAMRLPMTEEGQVDEDRAIRQIRSAVDSGVNYLDTAWPYHGGQSETILGRALKDGYRDKVKVATKLPSWLVNTRGEMDTYLNTQLDKLGVDCIDYYLLHALDGKSWDKLESLGVKGFLDAALADGRIKNAGFSFHGSVEDFKRIVDAHPWTFCQIQYNFLDQENQAGTEGLEYAAAKNLGVIIMEPLRGGNLGAPESPPAIKKIWDEAPVKRTPVAWALQWVWNRPEVTVVLSGMNDEAHIEENLAMAEIALPGSLTPEECELVDRVADTYHELMRVGCTGCGYCMPCPVGVMIPAAFEVFNKVHLFGKKEEGKFLYALRLGGVLRPGGTGYASQCVQCGECLEKCPQHINIPEVLSEVVDELEDEHLPKRLAQARKMMGVESAE